MKTNEIKVILMQVADKLNQGKLGEVLAFKFVETEEELAIREIVLDTKMVSVAKKKENQFYLTTEHNMGLDSEGIVSFTKKVMDYVTTPVAEREDNESEKRWRIQLAEDGFLCLKLSTKEYLSVDLWNIEDYNDDEWYQNKFIRSEIANYLKTDDEKIVDWFIERFGEEVTE